MSLKRVSIVMYTRHRPGLASPWGAVLTHGLHERRIGGKLIAGCALDLEVEALRLAFAELREPCAVECFQHAGEIKPCLLSGALAGTPALEALAPHAIQWYWWRGERDCPQYRAAQAAGEGEAGVLA
ncbi:ribonuclease HI [Natronocella acetinitrilica]|uniref:Ribonuclease HI n=1 Tax=Natronocella acetinitrilica TaxID=414046 RepID=A0AAE3KB07_9GAMM|nr:hypothetical protein [Natronocella acetinitrilica]MCP1674224.1 ribonuclease HI [Natronocella acetinitrilica]